MFIVLLCLTTVMVPVLAITFYWYSPASTPEPLNLSFRY